MLEQVENDSQTGEKNWANLQLSMKIVLTGLIFLHIQVVPLAYSQKSNMP